ncbi:non-canonical purine NTP diphosphatase [Jejuia pallidilutea]|uniref:dITP/XTP pyrophosphatase n=1 Tax=Jejuia pallidilutea TaxID=504487 RepID=A0A090W4T6_9FLAO|nr:non-canonical purine NTP diphosphatase [Jejuia pallidilutea]PQV46959.1 XTP/dITP diphosphohydrolase [Jejuia pallidilutea]GAL68475.1 nucleoside 5-triphosphatase RdgB [Jejuia pallidilutea]GAL71946.1 nucleoside 5-triphosphatase RdgB [Jejuia pallidilutea]GAL89596.1 nucleoside 5-triphosphatase RdgB [Jejuia pallidilutea]
MEIVFATNNLNKLKEVQALMPSHIKLLSLKDIKCFDEIPETQNTIEGNAIEKATYIKEKFGYNCFADDTGLEVEALNGEPGVFSARYAGPKRDATDNMSLLLKNLKTSNNRNAHFKTVIALHFNNKLTTFTGICKGAITTLKAGNKGFGYDPIFKPTGYNQTFAEMDLALKNKIGHRGKATKQLIDFLNNIS